MFENQPVTLVTTADLVSEAQRMRDSGHRLVHICCTAGDPYEITYAFDKDRSLKNLRVNIPGSGSQLPSITSVYLGAFGYENELHDLFGVEVVGNAIDYKGNFYRTTIKAAFAPAKTGQPPAK